MGKNNPAQYRSLAKKISKVELLLLFALIMMWVLTYAWMGVKRSEHLETMSSLQQQILLLAKDSIDPDTHDLRQVWPLGRTFPLLILRGSLIVNGTMDEITRASQGFQEAFGNYLNADVLFTEMSRSTSGSTWIRADQISERQRVTWLHSREDGLTFVIVAHEKPLLALSGYTGYSFVLMLCAVLGSALLLMALIWALSWMRLSAVKGLVQNKPS